MLRSRMAEQVYDTSEQDDEVVLERSSCGRDAGLICTI